jgi:hypothetical protein
MKNVWMFFSQRKSMEARITADKNSPVVSSPPEVIEKLAEQLRVQQQQWLQRLTQEPQCFANLEVAVHHAFAQLADQLVASLLVAATQESFALEDQKKK